MKVTGWKALRYNWIEYITVIRKQEKDMRQSPTKQRHNVFPPPHVDGVPWLRRQFSMKENNTHYLKNIKLHRYGIICLIYLHVQTHLFIFKRNMDSSFLCSTCIYELLAWLRKPIDTVRAIFACLWYHWSLRFWRPLGIVSLESNKATLISYAFPHSYSSWNTSQSKKKRSASKSE